MNAKDLELKISGLQKAIEEHKADASRYEDELKTTTKKLEDINKPELTPLQFDLIQEAVERGVDNFDFSDTDKYGKEFGLDYDGRVMLDSLELNDTYELIEGIVERVHKLFTEAECPEDDDSQLNTQTVAEKII